MDEPELISVSQADSTTREITAHLPSKEALKSMFTMLVGNPDSMLRIFNKPMVIDKNDIDKLDEQICSKLGIHQVQASKTTFDLTLSDNTILEFERWRGAEINLALPQYVTEVAIRWDFIVQLPQYDLPQRHILSVRMGEGRINIARIMQAAFSRDPEDVDKYDLQNSPLYCRVDFINQILSQELINSVDAWHKGTREATGLLPKALTKKWATRSLRFFLNYSVPLWAALVSLIFLFRHFEPARLTQPLLVRDLRDALAWTFIAFIATAGLFILFKQIANYAQQVITRHVPKTRFQLTNGDTNRQAREKRNATTKIIKSGLGFLATLICNLLAAYIFARIFYTK